MAFDKNMIGTALALVLGLVPDVTVKKGIDKVIDIVEDYIKETENDYDDQLQPALDKLRSIIGVPDSGEFADEPVE